MMTSRRLSESEQRAADDNARSLRRNASWLHRYGYIVPASELFTHGCGPVTVLYTRTDRDREPFHKNTQDNPALAERNLNLLMGYVEVARKLKIEPLR